MDEKTVREQLDDVKRELTRNEEEHEVLENLLKGLEGWLRLRGPRPTVGPQLKLPLAPSPSRTKPKGVISVRAAILQVLKEARGQPLHCAEILRRAQELGAVTSAKRPESIVDLSALSLKTAGAAIERIDSRIWRWAGEDAA